jgi:cysteinyl-tRNA synthetase
MSKSLGNLVTLTELLEGHSPEEIRFFVLSTHYRNPLDFSDERIDEVARGLKGFYRLFERLEETCGVSPYTGADESPTTAARMLEQAEPETEAEKVFKDEMKQAGDGFFLAMDDDFNTAGAIGHLNDFTHEVNRLLDSGEALSGAALAALDGTYDQLGEQILGVLRDAGREEKAARGLEKELVETMIQTRAALREAGQYELADDIRDRLSELGIELKDSAEGTEWEYK